MKKQSRYRAGFRLCVLIVFALCCFPLTLFGFETDDEITISVSRWNEPLVDIVLQPPVSLPGTVNVPLKRMGFTKAWGPLSRYLLGLCETETPPGTELYEEYILTPEFSAAVPVHLAAGNRRVLLRAEHVSWRRHRSGLVRCSIISTSAVEATEGVYMDMTDL